MKFRLANILLLAFLPYISIAQEDMAFERSQEAFFDPYSIPDVKVLIKYRDSLSTIYKNELLTACVYSNLHELVPNIKIDYSINNTQNGTLSTDMLGCFFINMAENIQHIRIKIESDEYYFYDSTFQINSEESKNIFIELKAKYKILLRGRLFAGNLPLEGANINIKHNEDRYSLTTLGCYTDDEDYWNCLYLGMFKQEIAFENPNDSLKIAISKEGFKDKELSMTMAEYDGTILPLRLRYSSNLIKYPKHNIGFKFGHTFQSTWSVGINYIYQLQIGNFNRLGVGLDGAMLMNSVSTQHSTFENLPPAEAATYYAIGMIGPLMNFSLSKPTNRMFNIYMGLVFPYMFPNERIAIHPYVAGKFYLDINKAIFWEAKYVDYTINKVEYVFNPYGEAQEIKDKQDYQKILISLGLLVSF